MFKFELGQKVEITISGEQGSVYGRVEYAEEVPQYLVKYKAADGRAVDGWFLANELK
jgi:hypothetical protein